jgi:hypothetical protein
LDGENGEGDECNSKYDHERCHLLLIGTSRPTLEEFLTIRPQRPIAERRAFSSAR